jgi:hypothetical protein
MRFKKYLLIFPLITILPAFSIITSCAPPASSIEIIFDSTELFTDGELTFKFKNLKESDNIECKSTYAPEYFSISPFDKNTNTITLVRSDKQNDYKMECPVSFYNNGHSLKTITITLSMLTKPIQIIPSSKELSTNDELVFAFENVKEDDNITCTSEYAPKYFSISSFNDDSKTIVLTRDDVEVIAEMKCPILFYNNGKLIETIDIKLPPSSYINYTGFINDRTISLETSSSFGTG